MLVRIPGKRLAITFGLAIRLGLLPLMNACASNGLGEDAINQRSVYQDDDSASLLLPSPKQASEEARRNQGETEEQSMGKLHGASNQVASGVDGTGEMNDIAAAIARIAVPQGQDEGSAFVPVKGRVPTGKERRKPIFLGKLGIEAIFSQTDTSAMRPALRTEPPSGMRLSARSGPAPGVSTEGMGTYIVRPGDSLSLISLHIYGTTSRWMELAVLNRLGNGSIIFPKELILYVPVP